MVGLEPTLGQPGASKCLRISVPTPLLRQHPTTDVKHYTKIYSHVNKKKPVSFSGDGLMWLLTTSFFSNVYRPVASVEKILPTLTPNSANIKQLASWLLRLPTKQLHSCFVRRPVCLVRVATDATQYTVLPTGFSALSTRQDVVNSQQVSCEFLATILTLLLVQPVQRLSTEVQSRLWVFVVPCQYNDLRNLEAIG